MFKANISEQFSFNHKDQLFVISFEKYNDGHFLFLQGLIGKPFFIVLCSVNFSLILISDRSDPNHSNFLLDKIIKKDDFLG